MKKKKPKKLNYTKETAEERRQRTSSGVSFRSVVFSDKRRKLQEKQFKREMGD